MISFFGTGYTFDIMTTSNFEWQNSHPNDDMDSKHFFFNKISSDGLFWPISMTNQIQKIDFFFFF